MVAKLIVWDVDRESATRRMVRAIREYEIGELKTLLPFHEAILQTEQWARAETCRDLIEDRAWLKTLAFPKAEKAPAEGEPAKAEHEYTVEVSGKRFEVKVIGAPMSAPVVIASAPGAGGGTAVNGRSTPRRAERTAGGAAGGADALTSPLQGTIFKVAVDAGATVAEGDLICVIEAMKMENEITAHKGGVVAELPATVGAAVSAGDTLAVIKSAEG
jgi:acetyl-CoA/propionyl-CoA carboxylase biotin carboxyl carrier protein